MRHISIDATLEAIVENMAKQRIKLGTLDNTNPFMPPITEMLTWLRGPADYPALLWSAQQEIGLVKPSLNTLKNLFKSGVTPRSARQVEANIGKLVEHYDVRASADQILSEMPLASGENGVRWLFFPRGVIEGVRRHKPFDEIEIGQTIAFLQRRAEAEAGLISVVLRSESIGLSKKEKAGYLRKAMSELLSQHVLIGAEDIRMYCDAVVTLKSYRRSYSHKKISAALRGHFYLRVDFYHQLFANFMADIVSSHGLLDPSHGFEKDLVEQGVMVDLIPTLEDAELVTPTEKLYKLWSRLFSSGGEPMSYRQMATHIPSPKPERTRRAGADSAPDMYDSIYETQRGRMAEWRDGTVPNTEQLVKFLESLVGDSRNILLPFLMTRMSTIWTAWIKQEKKQLDDLVSAVPALAEHLSFEDYLFSFSRYPAYWAKARAQADR